MTTTRRGWRAALDSPLLRTVVVCGSLSVLLSATPAASVAAGQDMAVVPARSAAAFVAAGPNRDVVDKGSPETFIIAAPAVAPSECGREWSGTSESIPRDSADDDDDDDGLEHWLSRGLVQALETREPKGVELDPSLSLESDGHSLRAPPQ